MADSPLRQGVKAKLKTGVDGASQRFSPIAKAALSKKIRDLRPTMWEMRFAAALPQGALAVDVGAHIGLMSMVLASRFDRVVAIEPNPTCVTRLRSTMPANVTVVAAAVAESAGVTELRVPRHNGRAVAALGSLAPPAGIVDSVSFTVPSLRLDDMDLGQVDFLKIDVEGYEPEVLAGAALTLQTRPVVLIEAEERHRADVVRTLTSQLQDHGLNGLFVSSGLVHDIEEFDPALHQVETPTIDGTIAPGYAANFVFVPAEARQHWRTVLLRAAGSGVRA